MPTDNQFLAPSLGIILPAEQRMNRGFTYNSEALKPLVERVDRSYYNVINTLCETAKKQARKLQELEVHQSTSQYITLCNRILDEIQRYVKNKKDHFLPYMNELFEKQETGHDCRNCTGTGSCDMQHNLQLMELKESHAQIKDILYRLQMVALPLYSETIYPDVYRILRSHMALIENSLTELFSVEETLLIPKVSEAQKTINARD